jgi:archaellum component FlaC
MLSHISTVTVMVFFMIWESVRGQLSPVYMTIATVVGVIPLIGEVICWKSNTEHAMIKHLVSYGFSLFYTICLFTSPTNLIYVFVIPMIFVVTTYSDTRYLLLINTGAILECIIVVVIGATKGGFGYHGIEAAVVQIVVMIMVGANSVLTTKVIRENTRKRFTEVAVAVEEIGNSMTLTLKALAEGKQDIEHLASEVEASVDNGTEVTEKLENLNQYMDEMNSIVELIGGITNQTSLLALNASIEAARAGEAGRGFSVVATEISGMATRTKEATVHITELISNVSNAIMEVVGVVSNMIDGINEEKTGASNAEESFESIEDNTRAIQKNADTLSRSISELQNANKEIIDSIQTISAISQQVSAHAGETMQAEEENLNVMQDVSAIMQKLATLAANS